MKKVEIFKKIDQEIFKQVDNYKGTQVYQSISDEMRGLSEQGQKGINYGLTFLFTILPFAAVITLFVLNQIQKSNIRTKEEILAKVQLFKDGKKNFDKTGRGLLSPIAIQSKSDLQNRISSLTSRKKINETKISIQNFDVQSVSNSINKVYAKLNVKDLNRDDLNNILIHLLTTEKMKVEALDFSRNNDKETLQGTIEVIQYSKKQG